MRIAPLHERLHALHLAISRDGEIPQGWAAELDPAGMITLHTDREPIYLWRHTLASAAAGAAQRYAAAQERKRDRFHQDYRAATAALAAPPVPAVAARKPKAEPLPSWSAHRIPISSAPKRAVGNFTTRELRERTIEELRANLRTAQASGHAPLVKVMEAALATACGRPVDSAPNRI